MATGGTLAPWKSPAGASLRIAAASPVIPWSDLVYWLLPNGRTLDYQVASPTTDLSPIGVFKQSYSAGLYAVGAASGYHALQLHPGAWHYAAGHAPRLKLLGQDPPYAENLQRNLLDRRERAAAAAAVHETPGASGTPPAVTKPLPPPAGPGSHVSVCRTARCGVSSGSLG